MKLLFIIIGVIAWVLLFLLVLFGGSFILEGARKNAKKKWGTEERDYDHEKWMFRFYVIIFFIGVPLLLGIAVWQEFFVNMSLTSFYL